jgi:hypothetical protein
MSKHFYEWSTYIFYAFLAVILYFSISIPKEFYFFSIGISVLFIIFKNVLNNNLLKKLIFLTIALELIAFFFMVTKKTSIQTFNDIDTGILIAPFITLYTIQYFRNYKAPVPKNLNKAEKKRSDVYKFILKIFLILLAAYILYAIYELLPLYLHH